MINDLHPSRRLSREEAANFLITWLIATGQDPNNELLIDGNPGVFFRKYVNGLQIDWKAETQVSGVRILAKHNFLVAAQMIGYDGRDPDGIFEYLETFPKKSLQS